MSSLTFRRFTSGALRTMEPTLLLDFLRPHSAFLAKHKCPLPENGDPINAEALEGALLLPRPDTPPELVDALWHIHEMATPQGMEILVEEARRLGIDFAPNGDHAPADVALRVWLADAETVRRKHAEQSVLKRTSYETFAPRDGAALTYRPPDAEVVARIEAEAETWYASQLRGPGARVFIFQRGDELRMLFRHGGTYCRDGKLDGGAPSSVHYRPLVVSVASFNKRTRELRINCGRNSTKREMQFLRECVGLHLFGQRDFFAPDVPRYNLEPLRRDGERSLVCADIPGIERVRLVGLRAYRGGPFHRATEDYADDLFLAMAHDGDRIRPDALLTEAILEFTFADSSKPRRATVRHGNKTKYPRDGDGDLIEAFLRARGFVQGVARAAVEVA